MLNLSNLFALDRIADISKRTGISTGNICDWKSGRSKPSAETLVNIAECYSCSVDYLLGRVEDETQTYSDDVIQLIDMSKIIPITTYTQPVSAGKGNIYLDDKPVSALYPSTQISSKADYCVKISGDSMFPNYLNGDTVYVTTKEQVKHGDIGIFLYNREGFCKKYYEQDGVIKLISLNPDQEEYAPITIENDTLKCQGKVIGRFHTD